jgi:hypothetical protein
MFFPPEESTFSANAPSETKQLGQKNIRRPWGNEYSFFFYTPSCAYAGDDMSLCLVTSQQHP